MHQILADGSTDQRWHTWLRAETGIFMRFDDTQEPLAHTLQLVPYDPAWPARFEREAARIHDVIGNCSLAIEHVGSTSVPGLLAKPILDLAIAVGSEVDADACIAPLEGLGYLYRGPYGDDPRRRYYVRDEDGRRVSHLHLYILPASAWDEKLAFPNALRSDPGLAAAYAAEKYRIAESVDWVKASYSLAKGPFIERVLASLRAERSDPV